MHELFLDLTVILIGAAVLSYLAVLLKQPIIVAYILCGVLAGPWGLGLVKEGPFVNAVAHWGITLLLFLAGLCLHPQHLLKLFRKTSLVTLGNAAVSFLAGFGFSRLTGFSAMDSVCIGLALMFSSTILTLKLLPTTRLHQEKMGAVCISILIAQDLIAIGVLVFLRCMADGGVVWMNYGFVLARLAGFVFLFFILEQFLLRRVLIKIDRYHEAVFVIGLAWCFGGAVLSHKLGLFYETGAFVAGVALARHPVARFINEALKPIRDFFLVIFFFVLGAELELFIMMGVWFPALILSAVFLVLKPFLIQGCIQLTGEAKTFAREAGWRLGQLSEFSLLIALLALDLGLIGEKASQFIQLTTILTFIVSSYIVVFRFPTPIGTSEKLFKD